MTSEQVALNEKKNPDWRILLALFLAAFITRSSLINWYSAEYSDAILYITFFYNDSIHIAPLYGFILEPFYNLFSFIPTHEFAGSFISILSASLSVVPLFLIGRYFFTDKVGVYSVLFFIVSPVALRWNIRVMTDSLFTLFFLLCVYSLVRLYYESDKRWLFWSVFLAGMASLTRYQGLALTPIVAFLCIRELRRKRYWALAIAIPAVLPWLFFCWWIFSRKFGQIGVYKNQMQGLSNYLEMFTTYMSVLPYALTYPVFALFCYGVYKSWRMERGRVLAIIFAALFLPWLIMHTFYSELVIRTFLPLFPLAMIFAAYAATLIKREKTVMVVSLVISMVCAGAVLYYQRDTFGDIKRASQWVRFNVDPSAHVYATDSSNLKTKFWSRRDINKYRPDAPFKPGDYLLLPSFYTYIEKSIGEVNEKYRLKTVYETASSIVPLLPDITDPPEHTMTPGWKKFRFKRHNFRSVVVKVVERREEPGGEGP